MTIKNSIFVISGSNKGLGKSITNYLLNKNFEVFQIKRPHIDLRNLNNLEGYIKKNFKNLKKKKIIYINNAASTGPLRLIGKFNFKDIINTISINVTSYFIILNYLISLKKKTVVINITSGAAYTFNKFLSIYSCSKLFNIHLTKYLKKENKLIQIFNFNPGIFNSPMHQKLFKKRIIKKKTPVQTDDIINKVEKILDKIK